MRNIYVWNLKLKKKDDFNEYASDKNLLIRHHSSI